MPPWWVSLGIGGGLTICLAGIRLLAFRTMNFDDPWIALGWGMAVGGGASCFVWLLLYWRWRAMRVKCHTETGSEFGLTFREIDDFYNRPNDPSVAKILALNPHIHRWYEHYPPSLLLVPVRQLPVVLIRVIRHRR